MKISQRGLTLVLIFYLCGRVEALGQNVERVLMAVPGIGLSQLPAFVAQEKGFYKQERLEVLIVVMDGSNLMTVQRWPGAQPDKVRLARSFDPTAEADEVPDPYYGTKADFEEVADMLERACQGILAVTQRAEGEGVVLEHLGVDPKEVSIVNIGNSSLRLAALKFKKIDATILDTAFVRKAEEFGFKRLVSLADLGEIPSTGLVVTTTKLKKQPDQIRRVVRATLKGTNYFKENRGEMISFITKKLAVDTKEAEELFQLGVKVFSSNGRISDEGLSVLLRQRDPKRQLLIKPSDVVDWSFLPTKLE